MTGMFEPGQLTSWLHQVPHLTFTLQLLDDPRFMLENEDYYQSMLMITFMPILLLFITMIGLLIYYCCIGVKKVGGNKHESSACYCSLCVLFVFVTFAITCSCIVVYASMQVNSASKQVANSTLQLSQTENWVVSLRDDANSTENTTEINALKTAKVNTYLQGQAEWLEDFSFYRFYGTVGLVGVIFLTCIFALISVRCKSRCLLIWSTSLILICIVIIYIYNGIDLMAEVGIADICMEPYRFLFDYSIKMDLLDRTSAFYFIYCPDLTSNTTDILHKQAVYDTLLSTASSDLSRDACVTTQSLISDVVTATCVHSLEGNFLLSCTLLLLAFILTVISCAAPLTWRRFTKIHDIRDDESDDVFLQSPTSVNMTSIRSNLRTHNPICISNHDNDDDEDEDDVMMPSQSTNPRRRSSVEFSPGTATFLRHSHEAVNLLEGDKPPPYSPPRPR